MKNMEFKNEYFNEFIQKIRSTKELSKREQIQKSAVTWINWLKDNKKINNEEFNLLMNKLQSEMLDRRFKKETFKIHLDSKFLFVLFVISFLLIISAFIYLFIHIKNIQNQMQNEKSNGRVLPFKGSIKETNGEPLDTKRDARFSIYTVSENGIPVYTGTCVGENALEPSFNGSFTILIGSDCGMKPIPEAIFRDNQTLYLGISIGTEAEFKPRYQIMTSSFSQDTSKLQGLSIGNNISSIPFINENGVIELQNESPKVISENGIFSIEAGSLTLRSTEEGGNIIFDPAVSSDVIIGSGKLGIGTFNPEASLDVSGNTFIGSVVSFTNTSLQDSVDSSVLTLSLGTDPSASGSEFIQFYAGKNEMSPGVQVGGIRLNNQSVVYETSAADFAEYFEVSNSNSFQLYQIVAITKDGIKKATQNDHVLGITSNTAGYIGNIKYKEVESILVALVGQVNVLVTNMNGEIKQGDVIGTSKIEGYGEKKNSKTNKIGYVLEKTEDKLSNDNCPSSIKNLRNSNGQVLQCGKVLIVINLD